MRFSRMLLAFLLATSLYADKISSPQTVVSQGHGYMGLLGGAGFRYPSKNSVFFKSLHSGPVSGIFGGYDFSKWKIELQISDRESPVNHEFSSVSTSKTAEEWSIPFMLNGYCIPFKLEIVRPYIGAGIGYAIHSYAWHRNNPLSPDEFINFNHIRKYSNGFAYQAMAGLEFILSPNVNLDLEYCFWEMPKIHYGGFDGFDRVSTNLKENLVLIKLAYKFP